MNDVASPTGESWGGEGTAGEGVGGDEEGEGDSGDAETEMISDDAVSFSNPRLLFRGSLHFSFRCRPGCQES